MNKLSRIFAVAVSAIMLASMASCSKKPSTSTVVNSSKDVTVSTLEPGENYEGKVGEIFEYTDSGYKITLKQIFYPAGKKHPETNNYFVGCIFEAEKESKADSEIKIVALDDFDIFADGEDCTKNYMSTMSLTAVKGSVGEDMDIFNGVLSDKKTGFISFEIPANANEIKLVFHPNKRVSEDTVSYTLSESSINPSYTK